MLSNEKEDLVKAGRADLAKRVVHVSAIEGDGAGYDIRSFNPDGKVRYIEVKTTKGGISTPFFMAINEVRFSELRSKNYVLYRLFEFQIATRSGKIFKVKGNIKDTLQFEPISFRLGFNVNIV